LLSWSTNIVFKVTYKKHTIYHAIIFLVSFIETILGQTIPKDTLLTVATSISEDGTILVGDVLKGAIWYIYIPRLDILKREGLNKNTV